jgi:hypothetical protein
MVEEFHGGFRMLQRDLSCGRAGSSCESRVFSLFPPGGLEWGCSLDMKFRLRHQFVGDPAFQSVLRVGRVTHAGIKLRAVIEDAENLF